MNAVQLLGNLGRDPVIRATKTGRAVASFSLAVSRDYTTPQGEQRELTDWINIVAWGQLAEAVRSELKKGSRVFVAGRISSPVLRCPGRNKEIRDRSGSGNHLQTAAGAFQQWTVL